MPNYLVVKFEFQGQNYNRETYYFVSFVRQLLFKSSSLFKGSQDQDPKYKLDRSISITSNFHCTRRSVIGITFEEKFHVVETNLFSPAKSMADLKLELRAVECIEKFFYCEPEILFSDTAERH